MSRRDRDAGCQINLPIDGIWGLIVSRNGGEHGL
jgi:hypothetical protein